MTSPATTAVESPRQRRHRQTRQEIVDAAWHLAERHGVAGLSLREVARTIGMRAPSLYTYFASKDALFDEMFAEGYRQLAEAADRWTQDADGLPSAGAVGMVMQQWISFCQASPARYQLMFTRAVPGWEPSPEAYAASARQYLRMAEALVPLGIAEDHDLDLYTAVASGLAAQQMANDPTGDRWARLAPRAARMLLDDIQRRTS